MNLKHYNLLKVSAYINFFLGLAIVVIGISEFFGIIETNANTTIETVGIQLSYLVFVSGLFCAISGAVSVFFSKKASKINLELILGVLALGWPIFVSISLFFSQLIICIRLLPTTLAALFYVISVLIVKISNESFKVTHQINPMAIFSALGKRSNGIDIGRSIASAGNKAKPSVGLKIQSLGNLNKNRRANIAPLRTLFNSTRRRSTSIMGFLYSGSRRRRRNRRWF